MFFVVVRFFACVCLSALCLTFFCLWLCACVWNGMKFFFTQPLANYRLGIRGLGCFWILFRAIRNLGFDFRQPHAFVLVLFVYDSHVYSYVVVLLLSFFFG